MWNEEQTEKNKACQQPYHKTTIRYRLCLGSCSFQSFHWLRHQWQRINRGRCRCRFQPLRSWMPSVEAGPREAGARLQFRRRPQQLEEQQHKTPKSLLRTRIQLSRDTNRPGQLGVEHLPGLHNANRSVGNIGCAIDVGIWFTRRSAFLL